MSSQARYSFHLSSTFYPKDWRWHSWSIGISVRSMVWKRDKTDIWLTSSGVPIRFTGLCSIYVLHYLWIYILWYFSGTMRPIFFKLCSESEQVLKLYISQIRICPLRIEKVSFSPVSQIFALNLGWTEYPALLDIRSDFAISIRPNIRQPNNKDKGYISSKIWWCLEKWSLR